MSSDRATEAIALEPVDALTVTTLVDNVTDSLLPDQGLVKRPSMAAAPRIAATPTMPCARSMGSPRS